MFHYPSLDTISLGAAWVTIGSFDGVHLGHRRLLQSLAEESHKAGVAAVVITFYPHPAVVLKNIKAPFYLTDPEEKAILMKQAGVDAVVTIPFDKHLASLSAIDFISLLNEHINIRQIWAGSDFALGRNRQGDIHQLRLIGQDLGFDVHVIPPINNEGLKISSSQIRKLIADGKVRDVKDLLGRWYDVRGKVIHGDGRGHRLGIPTANLETWPERILPHHGVYATLAWIGQKGIPSITNLGYRPTFEGQSPTPRLETNLLDYSADLYGNEIRLEFIDFIRGEKKFPSIHELLGQIEQDTAYARKVLDHDA
jgi:riboflavin kinase / FMN adenylyltransferase